MGNPVVFDSSANYESFLESLFSPYQPFYFNCGAAALAVALMAIIRHQKREQAEVLLPAYACPEIVSAVLYAGGIPVLVDLGKESSRMDLRLLESRLNDRTVAVVAVSLFGIPERVGEISSIVKQRNIFLVGDNAQCFPVKEELDEGKTIHSESDVVIYSFGRGKPVSLLGGGVALVKDDALVEQMMCVSAPLKRVQGDHFQLRMKLRAKVWLYNQLISPYLYWIPDSLPFLKLGKTCFKPLDNLSSPCDAFLTLLPANIQRYWRQGLEIQSLMMEMLADLGKDEVVDLAVVTCGGELPRLLRYPLLIASPRLRDELYSALVREGLGASTMYPFPLPRIDGLANEFTDHNPLPNAENFAGRILTLPVHSGVRGLDVDRMGAVINRVLSLVGYAAGANTTR